MTCVVDPARLSWPLDQPTHHCLVDPARLPRPPNSPPPPPPCLVDPARLPRPPDQPGRQWRSSQVRLWLRMWQSSGHPGSPVHHKHTIWSELGNGHATTWHVFRPNKSVDSGIASMHYVCIRCGYSIYTPRLNIFRNFFSSLKLSYYVALSLSRS